MTARRSCLSVPATQPRFLARAAGTPADQVILDLEDSVAPAAKEGARGAAVAALREHGYAGRVRSVRVNACDTHWCFDDLRHLVEEAGELIDVVVVPKVDGVEHVHFVDTLLSQLERKLGLERAIGLDLQVESARGLEHVGAIAAASTRNRALVFGPGDLGASLGMPALTIGGQLEGYPGDPWHSVLVRILTAARASGLLAIDGPYAAVRDLDGLRMLAGRSAVLGYDGKWALNPDQVDVLNQVYSPSREAFERARAIVAAYRQATDQHRAGAVMLGHEMIDEASRKMAEVVVERGLAAGLDPA